MPLGASFPGRLAEIKLKQPAMLVFVSLNHPNHAHLLHEAPAPSDFLKRLFYHIGKEMLHPKGTVIVALPVPYHKHASRIAGELATICR